jgi:hypothetical protein
MQQGGGREIRRKLKDDRRSPMKTRWMRWIALAVAVAALSLPLTAGAEPLNGRGPGGSGRSRQAGGMGMGYYATAATPLDAAEKDALEQAVLEEYGALNLYRAVLEQYEGAFPFNRIARSEQQHVNVLLRAADRYGVDAPENPGLSPAPVFATLEDACAAGVKAEIADAALYDELLKVTDNPDLMRVYENLQAASLNNHLPAFEACD